MLFPKGKPKRLSGRILNSVFSVASSKTFLGSLRLLVSRGVSRASRTLLDSRPSWVFPHS
jgi:hypothetical protein